MAMQKFPELWTDLHVLVVGDIMLDRFVNGHVVRVSPEAPVPVLKFDSEVEMLGGAANVARNIVSLGGKVTLSGVVGADEAGDHVKKLVIEKESIDSRIVRSSKVPTTVKTRYVSANQQIMRLDIEGVLELDQDLEDELYTGVIDVLADADALMLSDYAKGTLGIGLVRRLIQAARDRRKPVIVDPKTRDVRRYAGASVITPNASEAMLITGIDCTTDDAAVEAAREICRLADVDAAIVTRGAQGMTLFEAKPDARDAMHFPSVVTEVFDVSGAGDTVVAVLSLGYAADLELSQAAELANAAAGIAVGKAGTAVVSTYELDEYLRRKGTAEPKFVGADRAASIVADWKSKGLKVGFTNGCFDLIHPGHVQLLRRARNACDRLIVALNSDSSVRRLKGETRPIQSQAARVSVMAAMEFVDLVTIFFDDTPLSLIELIEPDILLKGADYTVNSVVGADVVIRYGGQVLIVPLEEGQSTTSIVARSRSDSAGNIS